MLAINNLTISYDGRRLFAPIGFTIPPASITTIMGSSGIGKSSIIGAISGLIPCSGTVIKSSCFSVFQDTNQLFPWFSVKHNLDLVCSSDYMKTVDAWGLTELLEQQPNKLSGGQRQRFTLIRAIYSGRELLLCDEPLSGLDGITKMCVIADFKKTIKSLGLSCLWITHDLQEAKVISDRILLLNEYGIKEINRSISNEKFAKALVS